MRYAIERFIILILLKIESKLVQNPGHSKLQQDMEPRVRSNEQYS